MSKKYRVLCRIPGDTEINDVCDIIDVLRESANEHGRMKVVGILRADDPKDDELYVGVCGKDDDR